MYGVGVDFIHYMRCMNNDAAIIMNIDEILRLMAAENKVIGSCQNLRCIDVVRNINTTWNRGS